MNRFASLDIGSNSILLYIAEKDESGNLNKILDRSEITRLGEGIYNTGYLSKEAMRRSLDVIAEFLAETKSYECSNIAAVGTMALRSARNSAEFLSLVKLNTGLNIEVISGDEEARLSYLAVKKELPVYEKNIVIFDAGGGSTEFIQGKERQIVEMFSLNIGAVKLTESYLSDSPVPDKVLKFAEEKISDEFGKKLEKLNPDILIGIGGTVTNLASIKQNLKSFDSAKIHNSIITSQDINEQIKLFSTRTIEERTLITGLQPKRADIILAGVLIVKTIMKKLKVKSIIVSDRGIRHGIILDRF